MYALVIHVNYDNFVIMPYPNLRRIYLRVIFSINYL